MSEANQDGQLKPIKTCLFSYFPRDLMEIQKVVWIHRRPFLISYHRVVLASSDLGKSGLFYAVESRIFRARLFATDLLEAPRIHLLSLFVHTVAGRSRLPVSQSEKPNPIGWLKYPFHLPLILFLRFRLFSLRGILFGLLHQCSWLILLCLCFWRNQSWTVEFLARRNIASEGDPLYLEVQASP